MIQFAASAPISLSTKTVRIATRQDIERSDAWRRAFAGRRKDRRYYEIVEDTIRQGFEYRYFVVHDIAGEVRAIQPFFIIQQDMFAGFDARWRGWRKRLRRFVPHAGVMRMLMIGCAAGEGHLDGEPADHGWIIRALAEALPPAAADLDCSLIVFKEFPAAYPPALAGLCDHGYARPQSADGTAVHRLSGFRRLHDRDAQSIDAPQLSPQVSQGGEILDEARNLGGHHADRR